jgi:predicted RNase H-like nuclease
MSLIAGVDGCPRGWIVVVSEGDEDRLSLLGVSVAPTFKDVVATTLLCDAVAVDIPIGLSDGPARAADLAARRFLHGRRASSVFPAPVRPVLGALDDYVKACALSSEACGKKLSKQAFNILPKISQADAALLPADQARLRECHPEVTFAALNGGAAMRFNKKTPAGRTERASLLSSLFDEDVPTWHVPSGAARDDLYDAAVLCWTAARIANGFACSLPAEPTLDGRGLRMEIVY